MKQSASVITDVGLSPARLESVTIEHDLQKNKPNLWNAIPEEYREKLAGVLIIKHSGDIDPDSILNSE
jgi:hypothetical protein